MHVLDKVKRCVETHNKWRREECLNMIASENVMSPMATNLFCSDFEGRYNEHTGPDCHYRGTIYSYEIEEICNDLFRENFNTPFVDVRPISGGVANLVVFNALTSPGDVIVSLGIPNGAHVSSTKWGMAGVRGLKTVDMVFDAKEMNIDVEKTIEVIEKSKPKLIVFGASMFLFPEPIKEIKELIDPSIKVVYDAAHVFGLIYNKEFQAPLEEGADLMTASTHKTFPGPQGAVVIGNKNLSEVDWEKIQKSIFPGIMSNTHIHRFPSLAITALEMNEFGREYAKQIIANSKALGKCLTENGFTVLCPDKGFTESHQIIVDVKEFGGGKTIAERLEQCNIITNKIAIPTDTPQDAVNNPSAIRLGSQELTRWGMKEPEMEVIAEFFERAIIKKEDTEKIKKEVIKIKKEFNKVHYCFD